ncbi:ABC transporter substrate-binding protein [Alteromonas sediminis]|nr:ABC transporter substrate-binding protein [Alteromonas sediminis]
MSCIAPLSSILTQYLIAISIVLLSFSGHADILLGTSNAQKGPSAKLGQDLNLGAEMYFDVVNQQGGIHGHNIYLLKLDDGYEPLNTVHNTKLLLEHNIVGLFNYVGTPNSKAVLPLIKRVGQLLITPFTGADILRNAPIADVFNLRASYEQEAFAQIDYLVEILDLDTFGMVIQADAFGLALEKYYRAALKNKGHKPLVSIRYRRNTIDIDKAAKQLREANVKAVLFVGTYEPLIALIDRGKSVQFMPIYSSVSFVSSQTLFNRLSVTDSRDVRVIVTEVVPSPLTCQQKICSQFREHATHNKLENPNHVHFEGYLNAVYVSEALKSCSPPVTRACLKETLEGFRTQDPETRGQVVSDVLQLMGQVHISARNP